MKAEDNQFPYVTLKESAAAPAAPGAGLMRAYVDAADGRLYLVDDAGTAHPVAFTSDVGGGGGGAGVLASTHYYPTSPATYTPTTTLADVDATNAAITFTAPDSGTVIVEMNAGAACRAQRGIYFALREGTTTLPGTLARNFYFPNGVDSVQLQAVNRWRITGLTPGSVHTYKLAFQTFGVGANPTTLQAGGSTDQWGPLVLVVSAG